MSTPPAPESHQNTQIDLSSASEEDLVSRLEAALAKQTFDSIYFLGGSLPLPDSASSLVVRWESPENHDLNHCIHWPPVSSKDQEALSTLLHDCTAVTFGRNGQDVLDKSYRKAGAFDPKRFCVNFCPYSSGIVSAITSILHPSSNVLVDRKVRAELYKLNIYSGPSGRFKTHVDTPRGATQFGSLVVCLPYHHSGGQLTVKHPADSNTETVFDWSGRVDAIHWAAFFSDCPHEVLEITAGHRVTLTYNLYDENEQARSEPQLLSSFEPDMDSAMPRLMKALMEHGQNNTTPFTLGYQCPHHYAHTNMAVYETMTRLGLKVRLIPYCHGVRDRWESEDWNAAAAYTLKSLRLTKFFDEEVEEYNDSLEYMCGRDFQRRTDIVWLNESTAEEAQLSYMIYMNQAESCIGWTRLALLIEVRAGQQDEEDRPKRRRLWPGLGSVAFH